MPSPTPETMVADIMERWPATIAVFLSRGMACPGCAMAPFMSVREAAEAYGLDAAELTGALVAAARGEVPHGPFPPPLPHGRTGAPA